MSIIIQPATSADIATILSFIQGLAKYEKLEHECVATEAQLKETLFGEHPYAKVLIASREGNPVGFALYFYTYSTFLAKPGIYLEDLYVNEEARGQGVGKKLLMTLAKIAHEEGCGRLEWAALDWNTPAIEFYKSIGAKTLDDWITFRLTEDKLDELAQT